jgi:hypothetical protein
VKPYAKRLLADARDQLRPEVLHKALAGVQRERSDQPLEVELLSRTEYGFYILNEPADLLAQLERSGCRNQTTSGSDQQRVSGRLAQAGQSAAHRRWV